MKKWLSEFWSRMKTDIAWDTIKAQISPVDWVYLVLILVAVFYGAKRGLMRIIAEILETIVVIVLTFSIYKKAAYFMNAVIPGLKMSLAIPIAYFVVLSLIFLMVSIIDSYLKKTMHTQLLAPIRILGGAALGFIHGVLILSMFSLFERIEKVLGQRCQLH